MEREVQGVEDREGVREGVREAQGVEVREVDREKVGLTVIEKLFELVVVLVEDWQTLVEGEREVVIQEVLETLVVVESDELGL